MAELKVAGNPALDWIFACHFKGDAVMPGCLRLDALWQLTGFFLGWLGAPGKGRALGRRRGEAHRHGHADRQDRWST